MSLPIADKYRCHCSKCIDFHAHFLQREVFETSHPHSVSSCFGSNLLSPDTPVFRKMFEPELQIETMEIRGINMHILSSAEVIQASNWSNGQEEARLVALVNDECATWVDRFPERFIGSAILPLGDTAAMMQELERAIGMGLRIVQLPSNYRGDYLGNTRFESLWSVIHGRDLVVFIHPDGVRDMWFQDYAMWNSIGQSIEEVKVMSSLIYEGVMDRFPGLNIVMAHGGGYMPHYMGRLDRNFADKPFTAKNLSKLPSAYLKDFYYDSCVYDPRTLEVLVERVGIDRVVLGGDYPVADVDPIDFLERVNLDDRDRARIAGGNALALLGLSD